MKILGLENWGLKISTERPLLISGPCSAETENQVLGTAIELKKIGVKIFRSGIWKPRTRPNNFEGVGKIGLQWLKEARQKTGMLLAVEVANSYHVKEAMENGIDILWIGARTTVNPFAVQEIADELRGFDIPVFVKNPINPDIDLWMGAIERIYQSGIKKIGAIHRGFSTYKKEKYRNKPQWQIPIDLSKRLNIPLICDPSHISGDSKLIFEISQKAMDLNYDGLMIETHTNPQAALSDKNQQITPLELLNIINNLIIRNTDVDEKTKTILDELRSDITKIDDKLFSLLEDRMSIIDKIGKYKKDNNITILQPKRWEEMIQKYMYSSKILSEDFVLKLLRAIHQESINRQTKIMNEQ